MLMWFRSILLELDMVKEEEYIDPETRIDDEKSVGVMSDDLKKLWTLMRMTWVDSMRTYVEAHECKDLDEREKLLLKRDELEDKAKALESIFWIELRDEFGLWGKTVGVRRNFTVVARD